MKVEKVAETAELQLDPDVLELARHAQRFKNLCRDIPGFRGGGIFAPLTPECQYNVEKIKTRIEGR